LTTNAGHRFGAAVKRLWALGVRARWLAALGRGRAARLWILAIVLGMPLKSRIPRLADRSVKLRLALPGLDADVWLSDHSELLIIEEIWRRGEYEPAAAAARGASTILDLGANVGLCALWFRALNPDARIVAVEPDPRTFAKLSRNVGADPRIEAVNAGITPRSETVMLTSSSDSWGSRIGSGEGSGDDGIPVKGIGLDELVQTMALEPLHLVKMDIEGMEWQVLRSADCLSRVGMVIGEIHPEAGSEDPEQFLDAVASSHGLRRVPAPTARHFVFVADP
jgi:FkbM family methyltransferase